MARRRDRAGDRRLGGGRRALGVGREILWLRIPARGAMLRRSPSLFGRVPGASRVSLAAEGDRFLEWVEAKRRFYFNNYFKRVLHRPTGDPLRPTDVDRQRGYVVFCRDFMQDVFYNDTPLENEIGKALTAEAFAGQYEPVTVGILPLRDLGKVTVTASDLTGPGGKIPASAIGVGFVSYRISRVTMEGSVYTIAPRFVMPRNSVACPKDITRPFWITVRTPADAKPGLY